MGITGGGGSGAQIEVTSVSSKGAITGWQLWSPGSGYTGKPTGISGSAALSGAGHNFQVVSLTTTAAGSGYTTPPTVSLSSGAGFAATAVFSSVTLAAPGAIGGTGDITIAAADHRPGGLHQDRPRHADPFRLEQLLGRHDGHGRRAGGPESSAIPSGSLLSVGAGQLPDVGHAGRTCEPLDLAPGGAGAGPDLPPPVPAPLPRRIACRNRQPRPPRRRTCLRLRPAATEEEGLGTQRLPMAGMRAGNTQFRTSCSN